MMRKKISVLGSTGSIGTQTLDVVRSQADQFELLALAAGHDSPRLREQVAEFRPRYIAIAHASERTLDWLSKECVASFAIGPDAAEQIADVSEADIVVNGICGFAGLAPLLRALQRGKTVALANKESVVCAHKLIQRAIQAHGGQILPVDSEQSAIFQCMQNGKHEEVARLILTASGGPFWKLSKQDCKHVTVEQALAHPTWQMGQKITIDSATLFNKGLEVMEASYLFDVPASQIQVLIHPQSIVHSMVAFCDTTLMAQMSEPDMRLAIQYALTYPKRAKSCCKPLTLENIGSLTFFAVDQQRFPAIRLAYDALQEGNTLPIAYNAANEEAVNLFLDQRIRFDQIEVAVETVMNSIACVTIDTMEDILSVDDRSRMLVQDWYRSLS